MTSAITCIQWLGKTRNLSSLDLFAALLQSTNESIRFEAAVNLSARPEKVAKDILIRNLGAHYANASPSLKNIGYRFVPEVLEILADDHHELFPDALKTAVACEMLEALPVLITTAEQTASPYASLAVKLLKELSLRLGGRTRETGMSSDFRDRFNQLLNDSLENYSSHRNAKIVDAFLACLVPDDAILQSILNDSHTKTFKLLSRHWKTTGCAEAIDLLVQVLWKHYLSHEVQQIIFRDRRDRLLGKSLAKCMRRELTGHVIDRLKKYGTPVCCITIEPDDNELPLEDRLNLWRLLAITGGPLAWFLKGVRYFLASHREQVEIAVADMLKLNTPPSCIEVMNAIGLDDIEFGKAPLVRMGPLPDQATNRENLQYLLDEAPRFAKPLQDAIECFFHDFTCEHMINKLSSKNDEYLEQFAKVVVLGERDWEESLKAYMLSPTPAIRCKGTIASTYFPPSLKLQPTLRELLDDAKEVIREEAAFALARYKSTSIEGIHPVTPQSLYETLQNTNLMEASSVVG
ncbi:MAG: hypothetical protein NTW52_03785 [Planctomycetota bacterium]|nr:hypothetical protein [Planctomycetota bacterium]